MTRQDLEVALQSIFEKENEVNKLIANIKTIKEEYSALVQRLRRECSHEEVSHSPGYICKKVKLIDIDMAGHFEYEEVDVVSPHRKCVLCGLYEMGEHVLDRDALKKRYENLPINQPIDIDSEYIFRELRNQEKRKVTNFKENT